MKRKFYSVLFLTNNEFNDMKCFTSKVLHNESDDIKRYSEALNTYADRLSSCVRLSLTYKNVILAIYTLNKAIMMWPQDIYVKERATTLINKICEGVFDHEKNLA